MGVAAPQGDDSRAAPRSFFAAAAQQTPNQRVMFKAHMAIATHHDVLQITQIDKISEQVDEESGQAALQTGTAAAHPSGAPRASPILPSTSSHVHSC